MPEGTGNLPEEPAQRLTIPFLSFLRIESASGAVLLLCALVALGIANSAWSSSYHAFWEMPAAIQLGSLEITRSLKHWINDGLMTLFFFLVALELKRELVLGELRSPRTAALSLAAALGGMMVPVAFFWAIERNGAGANGWGAVMATDTAFVVGCLALLGSRIPHSLRLFLLSLAIFDDIGAILVVAIGYGSSLDWLALGLASVGALAVVWLARLGIRSIVIYCAAGGLIWLALDVAGLHPTLAGVVLGLLTPTRSWVSDTRLRAILNRVTTYPPGERWSGDTVERQDLRRAGVAVREALSPVERLEIVLHPWVAFGIMPLFALANAGVAVTVSDLREPVVLAIFIAFVLGKPIGVFGFSYFAVAAGVANRPADLPWPVIAAGGLLTGIGFTMALFIAEMAFPETLINSAKLSILGGSAVAAMLGLLSLAWSTVAKGDVHS